MSKEKAPDWRIHFFLGSIFIINTIFIKFSFSWPWNSESFTLGVIGLIGLTMLYISWYRFTFKRKGLVPWLDLWQRPKDSVKKEFIAALFFLILAYILGINKMFFPEPTALILSLLGLLMLIQSVYVFLSIGILSDD
jgi:hypothetical protein